MKLKLISSLLVAGLGLSVTACCTTAHSEPAALTVVSGKVTDLQTFAKFIESKPNPDAFRQKYPDVNLVLPGQIATKEFRMDNSRYFAELDTEGRIIGGRFM